LRGWCNKKGEKKRVNWKEIASLRKTKTPSERHSQCRSRGVLATINCVFEKRAVFCWWPLPNSLRETTHNVPTQRTEPWENRQQTFKSEKINDKDERKRDIEGFGTACSRGRL